MSQAVRPPIQSRIAQLTAIGHHCHTVGKTTNLLREQLMQRRRLVGFRVGAPVSQLNDLLGLGVPHHQQTLDSLCGIFQRGFQEYLEMVGHTRNRLFLEQIGAVLESKTHPFGRCLDHAGEVEAGYADTHPLLDQVAHPRSRLEQGRFMVQEGKTLVSEHHLENRVVSEVTLWPQCLNKPLEGNFLVALRIEKLLADLYQYILEARVSA